MRDPGRRVGCCPCTDRLRRKCRFRYGFQQHGHERKHRHSQSSQNGGNAAWRTGLGVLTEASASGDTSKVNTITAVVVLDGEGKVADVMLDEMELSLSADSSGGITLPSDLRTKRQKGSSYPLAAVSSLEKGWAEQADAFGRWLTGKTPDEVRDIKTDEDGRPADADLLSGCTIAVDGYRDAILRACENAKE